MKIETWKNINKEIENELQQKSTPTKTTYLIFKMIKTNFASNLTQIPLVIIFLLYSHMWWILLSLFFKVKTRRFLLCLSKPNTPYSFPLPKHTSITSLVACNIWSNLVKNIIPKTSNNEIMLYRIPQEEH